MRGVADEKDDRALLSSREETSDNESNNGFEVPELIKRRLPGLFTSVDISAFGCEFWVVGAGVEDAGNESFDEKEEEETAEEEDDDKHEGKEASPTSITWKEGSLLPLVSARMLSLSSCDAHEICEWVFGIVGS